MNFNKNKNKTEKSEWTCSQCGREIWRRGSRRFIDRDITKAIICIPCSIHNGLQHFLKKTVLTRWGKTDGYCYGREGKGPETCGLFLNTDETECPKCGGKIRGPKKPKGKSILVATCSRYWNE